MSDWGKKKKERIPSRKKWEIALEGSFLSEKNGKIAANNKSNWDCLSYIKYQSTLLFMLGTVLY